MAGFPVNASMKSPRTLLFLLPLFFLGGCLDVEKVVKINPDGSGTVTERVLLGKAVVEQMKSMATAFGGKPGDDKGMNLADEKKAKADAAKMGEGVTVASVKKISSANGEGAEIVYAFKDINKLKLDQNPSSSMPGGPGGGPSESGAKTELVTFLLTKGSPATLVVTMPKLVSKKADKEDSKETPPAANNEMAAEMAKQMFKDMRVKLGLEFAGKIVTTNAEYHTDSQVTLMEMDFNKLLADSAKFTALTKANPQSLEEAKALMKGLDGIKVETSPQVTVSFQ